MIVDSLREAAMYRWLGEFSTPLGKTWRPRIEAAESYYLRNSGDWDYLRDLFANMQNVASGTWNPQVAMAFSIITAAASDTYFNNPESWIQAKSGDPTGVVSRAFRDIANTAHREADTGGIMRKCLICDGFAGYGVHWSYFEQVDNPSIQEPVIENGQPAMMEDGVTPKTAPKVESQAVCGDFCEPWDFRVDPDGRDWKLKDHKYIIRKYRKTIRELLDFAEQMAGKGGDFPDANRAMLYTWAKNRRQSREHASDSKWGSETSTLDNDIGYMPVDMWEIWCRVSKMVIHVPVGADFDLGSYQWPRAWRYANTFPATFVAFNWEPGDRARQRGFYPVPLLRLIREQIENINDLDGLYMEAATSDIVKFLTVKGLLEDDEVTKLTSNLSRELVNVDITKLREFFPGAVSLEGIDLRKVFHQLEARDKGASFEYEKAIEHELRQIARIVGAGPQDRFGLPEARSATEAAGLIDAMGKRGRTKSELAANKYDEITEKFFLIFKTMQTLPIEYRAATEDFSEGVWRQWTDLASVRTLNLAFDHRAGSSTARDPQAEAASRNAAAQMLLPIYQQAQDYGKVDALAKWMLEPQNFRNLGIFESQSKEMAKQIAFMTALLSVNPKLGADPDFADAKANLASTLSLSLLGPADTHDVAARVESAVKDGTAMMPWAEQQGGAGGAGQRGAGPPAQASSPGALPSQPSRGQSAFAGSAAAGMTNVG